MDFSKFGFALCFISFYCTKNILKMSKIEGRVGQELDDKAGFLNHNWKSHGGNIWEIWKLEPCCGSPCSVGEGIYCCM